MAVLNAQELSVNCKRKIDIEKVWITGVKSELRISPRKKKNKDINSYVFLLWRNGWLVGFYGIWTFIGYLMPNSF